MALDDTLLDDPARLAEADSAGLLRAAAPYRKRHSGPVNNCGSFPERSPTIFPLIPK